MKIHTIPTLLGALSLGILGALPSAAQTAKPMSHTQGDHVMMSREPHHVLAMAYHQNLLVFSKALKDVTEGAGSVDVEFARAVEKEMRRSFAEMKIHHNAHLLTMNQSMHKEMNEMRTKMEKHHAELITMLDTLEKEVNLTTPDAKRVSTLAGDFYVHCSAMVKMDH